MKYTLLAYSFNDNGDQTSKFEEKFHVLDALKDKLEIIKSTYHNYQILEGETIIDTNFMNPDNIDKFWRPM